MDWDKFAFIYDWEFANICDTQKDDILFWERFAADYGINILELGAGSGRITIPLLKTMRSLTISVVMNILVGRTCLFKKRISAIFL